MTGIAIILFILNWKLALVVFSVIPPLAWISVRFQRALLKSSRRIRKINSQITAGYNEGIMAVRTTKTLVRERQNLTEFQDLSTEMFQASVRNAVQSAVYWPLVGLVGATGAGLALWFGGTQAMRDAISLGTMIAFINYAGQFFDPIHQLARILTELQGAQAAAERVVGLLDTEPTIKDSPEVLAAIERQRGRTMDTETRRRGGAGARTQDEETDNGQDLAIDGYPDRIDTIEFRGVTFAYKEGQPVLRDFNLAVQAGQNIALVGPTGGGKSTIVAPALPVLRADSRPDPHQRRGLPPAEPPLAAVAPGHRAATTAPVQRYGQGEISVTAGSAPPTTRSRGRPNS